MFRLSCLFASDNQVPTQPPCQFCGKHPAIKNSHVIPDFMGRYMKKNSPFGYLLNTWEREKQHDIYKGPYLCKKCDNEVFSSWEGHYAQHVFQAPLGSTARWASQDSINFVLSLAYRYAIHLITTAPTSSNRHNSELIRDLTAAALKDPREINKSVFVYAYVHRPLATTCTLSVGINHCLSLSAHGISLPSEPSLPNAMLIVVPKCLFLICDGDLTKFNGHSMTNPIGLSTGGTFHPLTSNTDLPDFLSTLLNRMIAEATNHQKTIGRWKKLAYGTDKFLNPNKACYTAQHQDKALRDWQRSNCTGKTLKQPTTSLAGPVV